MFRHLLLRCSSYDVLHPDSHQGAELLFTRLDLWANWMPSTRRAASHATAYATAYASTWTAHASVGVRAEVYEQSCAMHCDCLQKQGRQDIAVH